MLKPGGLFKKLFDPSRMSRAKRTPVRRAVGRGGFTPSPKKSVLHTKQPTTPAPDRTFTRPGGGIRTMPVGDRVRY